MALRTRRRGTQSAIEEAERFMALGMHDLPCKRCSTWVYDLHPDVTAVTCDYCTQFLVEAPVLKAVAPKEKRPRGWQFRKKYTSPSGIIYRLGKEVSANDQKSTSTKSDVGRVSGDGVPKKKKLAKAVKKRTPKPPTKPTKNQVAPKPKRKKTGVTKAKRAVKRSKTIKKRTNRK